MTDEEYIRKAVELADGWLMVYGSWVTSPDTYAAFVDESAILLDALAAQLVRQVDAIDCEVVTDFDGSRILDPYGSSLGSWFGLDRTMNTLKCIVDSGVLATEQGAT